MLPVLILLAAVSASADPFAGAIDPALAPAAQTTMVVDKDAQGSWYRKISSPDSTAYDGLTGWGILPQPYFDPSRMHTPTAGEKAFASGPLDNPGVYIGAHAEGREVDAGLAWDHRYDDHGHDTGQFAWRMFWRVASPSGNVWHNPAPGSDQDIYLNPGDHFVMTIVVRPDGTARLDVRGDGADAPSATASFPLNGFWNGSTRLPRRFKRVHSIDQFVIGSDGRRVGNERHPAIPTRTRVDGGRWEGATLLGAKPAPMSGTLAVAWRGADSDASLYPDIYPSSIDATTGGEDIVILPPHP